MLHPSYYELMEKVNGANEMKGLDKINSRYSIVIAASKRARQLIDGDSMLTESKGPKPLSVAVDELDAGKLNLVRD